MNDMFTFMVCLRKVTYTISKHIRLKIKKCDCYY